MFKTNRQILIFTSIVTLLCFIAVVLFTLPALFENLNLTTKSNIGGTIGGITAPIIGIISSILLYLALTRQTESNIDQRLKNESDIIFLLINQLDNELASFYSKYKKDNVEFKYQGTEAINDFTTEFRFRYDFVNFDFTFKAFFEANQFILIIRSYRLIEKRIQMSTLPSEMKELFQSKLKSFFACRLNDALTNISEAVDEHPNMKDNVTNEIQEFLKTQAR